MSTPIEPSRADWWEKIGPSYTYAEGEPVRAEDGDNATEWLSTGPTVRRYFDRAYFRDTRWHRNVTLPEVPTLGWLSVTRDDSEDHKPAEVLGIWDANSRVVDGGHAGMWSLEYVTAFTEAYAVPKAALDALREEVERWDDLAPDSLMGRFFADVDAAGEGK